MCSAILLLVIISIGKTRVRRLIHSFIQFPSGDFGFLVLLNFLLNYVTITVSHCTRLKLNSLDQPVPTPSLARLPPTVLVLATHAAITTHPRSSRTLWLLYLVTDASINPAIVHPLEFAFFVEKTSRKGLWPSSPSQAFPILFGARVCSSSRH